MTKKTFGRWVAVSALGGLGVFACSGDEDTVGESADGGADAASDTHVQDTSIDVGDSAVPSDANGGDALVTDAAQDASADGDAGLRCVFPQLDCNGACVTTDIDPANCGACGRACTTGATCSASHCSNAVSTVSAGEGFACALKLDGTVWCWGGNDRGELGVAPSAADLQCGTSHCNKTPQKIAGLANVIQVHAGHETACALEKDGTVWCWGKNAYGELGHASGTSGDITCGDDAVPCNPTPVQVTFPAGVTIAAVSAGEDVNCARATHAGDADAGKGGDVYCWGDNVHDTVGLVGPAAAPDPTHQATPTPNKVNVVSNDAIDVQVALGSYHACAVRSGGTVWCWGDDMQGRIGTLPSSDSDCANNICAPNPVQVKVQTVVDAGGDAAGDIVVGAALTGITAISVGAGASCALKSDGSVWCWGSDELAALSDKGPYSAAYAHPGARQILNIPAALAITKHGSTAYALDTTGSAFGWGEATYGIGVTNPSSVPCPAGDAGGSCVVPAVLSQPHLRQISAGWRIAVAIQTDDTVLAWGLNDRAQLGHAPGASGDATCGAVACGVTASPIAFP